MCYDVLRKAWEEEIMSSVTIERTGIDFLDEYLQEAAEISFSKGFTQGFAEGFAEIFDQCIAQGKSEGIAQVAKTMKQNAYDLDVINKLTGIPVKELKRL